MTRALVPIADGTEEMEAVISIDVMRRAGWEVVVAGLAGGGPVTASRGVRLVPDKAWDDLDPSTFDVIVIPGGGRGVAAMRKDARVIEAVRAHHARGKLVAAVCAGPLVLQDAGVLKGKRATCHPDVVPELTQATCATESVVRDGNVITSRGAGTSVTFALAIVGAIEGGAKPEEVARGMVAPVS